MSRNNHVSKMADGPFVLCDTSCFIVNKYGKVTEKALKSVMSDFYTVGCLSEAKLRLFSDIDKLDLSTLSSKRPHIPMRRDGAWSASQRGW